jgi:hypothetical protein
VVHHVLQAQLQTVNMDMQAASEHGQQQLQTHQASIFVLNNGVVSQPSEGSWRNQATYDGVSASQLSDRGIESPTCTCACCMPFSHPPHSHTTDLAGFARGQVSCSPPFKMLTALVNAAEHTNRP